MKRILLWTLLIVGTLFLTRYANDASQDAGPRGATFRMTKQEVVSCAEGEVVLEGPDGPTRLRTDSTWPPCSTFVPNQDYDLWLARGGRTGFISVEKSPWWRSM